MVDLSLLLITVVVLALAFDFSNGWHDAANAIATVVSTRVLSPFQAVLMAATLNVAGAFMSTAVARMVGGGIVEPSAVNQGAVAAALVGALTWNLLTLAWGTPNKLVTRIAGGNRRGSFLAGRLVRHQDCRLNHGFAAETTSAMLLLGTAHFGLPVSTTHTSPRRSWAWAR